MNPLNDDCLLMWVLWAIPVCSAGWFWKNNRKSAAAAAWVLGFAVLYAVWFFLGTQRHPWWAWSAPVCQLLAAFRASRLPDPAPPKRE